MRAFRSNAAIGLALVLLAERAWADKWDDLARRLVTTQIDCVPSSPQAASWGQTTSSPIIDVDHGPGITAQGLLIYYESRYGPAKLAAAQKAGQYIVQVLCTRPEGLYSPDIYFLGALYQAEVNPALKALWLATVNAQLDKYNAYPLSGVIAWYLANPTSPNLAAYDIAHIAVGANLAGHPTAGAWRGALIQAVAQLAGGAPASQTLGLASAVWGLQATGGMPAGTIPSGYFAGQTYAPAIQKARAAIERKVLPNGDLDSSLHETEGPMIYEPAVMGEALAAMPITCCAMPGVFLRGDASDDDSIDIGDAICMPACLRIWP